MDAGTVRKAAAERVEALLPARVREVLEHHTSRVEEVVEVLFRYDPRIRGFGARASCVAEDTADPDLHVGSIFRRHLEGLDDELDTLSTHYRPRLGEFIRVDLARNTTTFHPGGE